MLVCLLRAAFCGESIYGDFGGREEMYMRCVVFGEVFRRAVRLWGGTGELYYRVASGCVFDVVLRDLRWRDLVC